VSARPLSSPLGVRAMRFEDLAVVAAIEQEAYPYPWTENIFRDCLRVGYCCVVLEIGGEIIGYAVLSVAAAEAHLLNLCVRPARQRRGLGADLLDWLLARAGEGGAREVFLEVRPSNHAALQLYERAGFRRIGLRRNYYRSDNGREDAVVLSRPVPAPD
jgi:ribosomal-protein-alanine N-acetyltransferase